MTFDMSEGPDDVISGTLGAPVESEEPVPAPVAEEQQKESSNQGHSVIDDLFD